MRKKFDMILLPTVLISMMPKCECHLCLSIHTANECILASQSDASHIFPKGIINIIVFNRERGMGYTDGLKQEKQEIEHHS